MIEAPRPSTLGEILDRTAHMYRCRFLVFLGIAALPVGVVLSCAVIVFLYFAWLGSDGQKQEPRSSEPFRSSFCWQESSFSSRFAPWRRAWARER